MPRFPVHDQRSTWNIVLSGGAVIAGVLAWGEVVHARAAHRARVLPRPDGSRGAVIVLGFQNRSGRINMVNRWRARIGVRTARAAEACGAAVTMFCSGGAAHGPRAEADLLRDHIRRSLGWTGTVLTETESTSTWENVRNVLPLIGESKWIAFASNGLHAEKARVYLVRQRPDLKASIARADDYRPGEMLLVKPIFAAVGLWKLRAMFHVEHS